MRRRNAGHLNERGATLVMVALMVFMLLGMAALSIDYGMVKTARAEAQRAADAGALAGASIFLELPKTDLSVTSLAEARATEFTAKNEIRRAAVALGEIDVAVVPDDEKVTVTVTRAGIETWFARLFGINTVEITAQATARAAPAGKTPCVKPFALPDLWDENQRTTTGNGVNRLTGDTDGDNQWDEEERWKFDPEGNPDGSEADTYAPYDPNAEGDEVQTGYGSTFRDPTDCTGSSCLRDMGREITIKAQAPGDALGPGFFYLLRLQDSRGADDIKENITGCAPGVFSTDSTYRIEGGDKKGPVSEAINEVVGSDPGAHWNPSGNGGKGAVEGWDQAKYGSDWRGSPRVIKVGVFDPNQLAGLNQPAGGGGGHGGGADGGGNLHLQFNNIALLFLEGLEGEGQNEVVRARFLYYVSGTGDPGDEGAGGSLVKKLVLVK